MTPREIVANWAIGLSSCVAAIGITLTEFEQLLRILGAIGGLVVCGLTIVKLVRNLNK